jgi:CRP-like cAMP-binding protein
MKKLLGDDSAAEWTQFIEFHQKKFEFDAGEVIIRQGEPFNGIYAIVEGKVKVVINDQDGDRLVRLAANEDIIGHRGLGGDHRYPISAIALIPTTVNFISAEVFQVIAKTNPSFVYNLMMFLAEELRASEENQLMMPVLNRVARTLMMNYRSFGFDENSNRLSFTISRKDIATHASTTYESVIRTLADLAKRKVIALEGKAIVILDFERLKVLATDPAEA